MLLLSQCQVKTKDATDVMVLERFQRIAHIAKDMARSTAIIVADMATATAGSAVAVASCDATVAEVQDIIETEPTIATHARAIAWLDAKTAMAQAKWIVAVATAGL